MTDASRSADALLLASLARRYQLDLESVHRQVLVGLAACGIRTADLRDFVYRHSLPFFVFAEATGLQLSARSKTVASALLAYSIPLMMVDTYLDNSFPALRDDEAIWKVHKSPGDLLNLVYAGMHLAAEEPSGDRIVRIISRESSNVVSAMDRDWQVRRSEDQFEVSEARIRWYWFSPNSRLYGSHIANLMFEIAAICGGISIGPYQRWIGAMIGKLRQVADEHMDVVEDLSEGLITFPVLCSLNNVEVGANLRTAIEELWADNEQPSGSKWDEIVDLILVGGGPKRALSLANQLYDNAFHIANRCFACPEPVVAMLSLRVEQLRRGIRQRLSDPPPHATVPSLIEV